MKIAKRLGLSLLWILIPSCIVVLLSYQKIPLGAIGMVVLHAPFLYLLSRTWKGGFDAAPPPPAIPQEDIELKKQFAQQRVDAFYAEIFSDQISPYSGKPVLSEKDYQDHLFAKRQAEREQADADGEREQADADGEREQADADGKQFSMGRSFDELVLDQKLEQAKVNAMTKEDYAQHRVDRACAELFKGQLNPFTQEPIVCEADYRAYLSQHTTENADAPSSEGAQSPPPQAPQGTPPASPGFLGRRKYETYFVCPGCGQLVSKESNVCECGYTFRKKRDWRKHRRCAAVACLVVLAIGLSAFGGYRYGVNSMEPELKAQYELGYSKGETHGNTVGYRNGVQNTRENYPKVFEDAYRLGIADSARGNYSENYANFCKFDFTGRSALHAKLAQSYGFKLRFFLPT